MKSGSLSKLTTRPNTWELLFDNKVDSVSTFDIYVSNKESRDTTIEVLITPIPLSLLPANDSDKIIFNKTLEARSIFEKKGIVAGEFDYVYVRSTLTTCVVTTNGFIDDLMNDIGTTPYYKVFTEGGRSVSSDKIANFVLVAENVTNGTTVPYTLSDILLNRIESITVNGTAIATLALTGNFVVSNKYSILRIQLKDNNTTTNGEKITLTTTDNVISKLVNCIYPSLESTFNLVPSSTFVEEKSDIELNLITTLVADGSEFSIRRKTTTTSSLSGTLIGTYTVGTTPYGIVYDPTNNAVWVANQVTNNVTKLNATTGALIGTYSVGTAPYGIVYDPTNNAVWVANWNSNNVTKLNAATGALIDTYPVGTNPQGITYDPTSNAVWVTNGGSSTVTKRNAATGALIGTYTVGTNPFGILYNINNNSVYVVNRYSDNITKLNASTGALIGNYAVGTNPFEITYDPTNNTVWVTNFDSNNVSKLVA